MGWNPVPCYRIKTTELSSYRKYGEKESKDPRCWWSPKRMSFPTSFSDIEWKPQNLMTVCCVAYLFQIEIKMPSIEMWKKLCTVDWNLFVTEFFCEYLQMLKIAKKYDRKDVQCLCSNYGRGEFLQQFSIARIFSSKFPAIFTNIFQHKIIPVYSICSKHSHSNMVSVIYNQSHVVFHCCYLSRHRFQYTSIDCCTIPKGAHDTWRRQLGTWGFP